MVPENITFSRVDKIANQHTIELREIYNILYGIPRGHSMESAFSQLTPIKSQSKTQLVYDTLRQNIITGKLAPGSRLVINTLAKHLGVSQIPVREALQQLQADGFISIRTYVGAQVTEIHKDLIYEIFGMLEAMESISLRAACNLLSEDDLNEIEELLVRMDSEVGNPEEFSQSNVEFHLFICERAETPLVKSMLPRVLDHWDRLRRHYLDDVYARRIQAAQKEHWGLYDALCSRDADLVARLAREHNRCACAAYAEYLGFDSPERGCRSSSADTDSQPES